MRSVNFKQSFPDLFQNCLYYDLNGFPGWEDSVKCVLGVLDMYRQSGKPVYVRSLCRSASGVFLDLYLDSCPEAKNLAVLLFNNSMITCCNCGKKGQTRKINNALCLPYCSACGGNYPIVKWINDEWKPEVIGTNWSNGSEQNQIVTNQNNNNREQNQNVANWKNWKIKDFIL